MERVKEIRRERLQALVKSIDPKQFYSVSYLMEVLNMSRSTIFQYFSGLPGERLTDGEVEFRGEDLFAFVKEKWEITK